MERDAKKLTIDPAMGMAGDMFAAALLGLGVPVIGLIRVMELAARPIGGAEVTVHRQTIRSGRVSYRLKTCLRDDAKSISISKAAASLEQTLNSADIRRPYRDCARRALEILATAEEEAHRLLDVRTALVGRSMPPTAIASNGEKGEHAHGGQVHLHEAQDIIMDVAGAAWGLQSLSVDLGHVCCAQPVRVGGGTVTFSHGELGVPAPATRVILESFNIPWSEGPMDFEQLTPTGAAILAALAPRYVPRQRVERLQGKRGFGLGTKRCNPPNAVELVLE